uniref:C-type lectin domain family 5 member A n=1 Tax=Equus asinus asinus TaxID=83772 RepID=A0A8C4LMK1_EQUAS
MNWHMIISGLIVVVLKIVGMTFFLLYFPQIFAKSNVGFIPTENYRTGNVHNNSLFRLPSIPLSCPRGWDFNQERCFLLSTSELSWKKSRDFCETEGSTLAIVNTPEKLKFLQSITGAEKYFIGLLYQHAEKRWRWINNSIFTGNVTNQHQDFNCVTIGLTKTYDAASCDVNYRWICEKSVK